MTRRWMPGKKPTKDEIKAAITNATSRMLSPKEVEKIACAVMLLIDDRIAGRS